LAYFPCGHPSFNDLASCPHLDSAITTNPIRDFKDFNDGVEQICVSEFDAIAHRWHFGNGWQFPPDHRIKGHTLQLIRASQHNPIRLKFSNVFQKRFNR
jgi:hypothetical protein